MKIKFLGLLAQAGLAVGEMLVHRGLMEQRTEVAAAAVEQETAVGLEAEELEVLV
jgi:hypothetical protein